MPSTNRNRQSRRNSNLIKWTEQKRRVLYEFLKDEFGPHSTWTEDDVPSSNREEAYRQWRIALQALFSGERDNDGERIAIQIRYALASLDDTSNWGDGTWRNHILNKAAAFNAGFISHGQLAASDSFERRIARNTATG